MTPEVVLITQPNVDFTRFLGLSFEALGYSPAAGCDASGRQFSDAEKFLSCLSSFKQRDSVGLDQGLLSHVAFSVLIAADEIDMLAVCEQCAGMAFTTAPTRAEGILLGVISGTLAQWRDAVVAGTNQGGMVEQCFNKVMSMFRSVGLNVWPDRQCRGFIEYR